MNPYRRRFFTQGLATATVLASSASWRTLFAGRVVGDGPYGPLGAPDALGVRLPAGFTARVLATTGDIVPGTQYVWHGAPDGGAVFARSGGEGWVYASNSELDDRRGGVSVLRFDAHGEILDAYRILAGTSLNCAGGPTPWGTWLSCEEIDHGQVWECNPFAPGQGVVRPALGRFKHEAAAVDPVTGFVYLTEDTYDSRFYRFRPAAARDLSSGVLEAAAVDDAGHVRWLETPANEAARDPGTTVFVRGEGAWFAHGLVYFSTTADHRVWAYDTRTLRLEVVYDAATAGPDAPLRFPDNLTVHAASGGMFVAEDGDDMQIVLLAGNEGQRVVAPFLQVTGQDKSELTGPAFSPDGKRLYFSSQRGRDGKTGLTLEVAGPFLNGS